MKADEAGYSKNVIHFTLLFLLKNIFFTYTYVNGDMLADIHETADFQTTYMYLLTAIHMKPLRSVYPLQRS